MGNQSIVRRLRPHYNVAVLLLAAPLIAGCAGASDMFSSDLLSKDATWFSGPNRLFIKNISIEAPPLTPEKAVGPDDLISADGLCSGMAPQGGPGGVNALAGEAPALAPGGSVALGHTECDVARGIGSAPDNVQLSNNPRGDRQAVLTYSRGTRPGIYTFNAGRLTMVERGPEAAPPPARTTRTKKRAG